MNQEDAVKRIMTLDIKPNPLIPEDCYSAIAQALHLMYGVGYNEGHTLYLNNQMTHPVGIRADNGSILRKFESLKLACKVTHSSRGAILNSIKYNRPTRKKQQWVYLTERKDYKASSNLIK